MTAYALSDTRVLTGRSLRHILRSSDTLLEIRRQIIGITWTSSL